MLNRTQFDATLDVLHQVLPFTAPADVILSRYFRDERQLGARDRAAIAETVFGLLRHLPRIQWLTGEKAGVIEWLIAYFAAIEKRNMREMESIFDEKRLAQAKDWKAVDWSSAPLHVQASLPEWAVAALQADGMAEADILETGRALMQAAPLDLRVNILKMKRDAVATELAAAGIDAKPTPYSPWGLRIFGKPALNKHTLFLNGGFEVQDEGSQLLALLTGARRGQMVADFCAGAGGKTLAIGAMMQSTGRLYAFDISEKRLANLKPRMARSGLSNVQPQLIASENDQKIKRLAGKMDAVLVDAPCSGLGTLRRNPDLKFRQSEQSVRELNAKQASILASAARLVKTGGRLVYATCSILPSENKDVVDAFLAAHPDFELLDVRELLAKEKIDIALAGPVLQLWPQQHAADGFFAAVMVKRAAAA
ncbi:16S rRNA (cytosine967-C5)-methyltransferase [Andreprevotia lacus DSM 23236]|jgi:16S rRNA (cytosine967-C5)-methyltransferase|uniref:16S rRNA (Cytosine967-C5)-methyltransferase n=1 Tax=Andreprevotia lacus DSM 23236 TaxID=1121001 RepID=A0A1W1XTR4_9NEIS|nr:RsmB/NOP family class I SAM-dependent RNA methyltransferase [Andreprevotia lacus]SMC26898.1 16S rRNA (cytosine967-C5)-methyltransferase [Andreprevotia lacus DSM 23236]